MSEDIYIDVNYLTESERDIILQVLAKDEELRKQEKRRIRCINFVWTNACLGCLQLSHFACIGDIASPFRTLFLLLT